MLFPVEKHCVVCSYFSRCIHSISTTNQQRSNYELEFDEVNANPLPIRFTNPCFALFLCGKSVRQRLSILDLPRFPGFPEPAPQAANCRRCPAKRCSPGVCVFSVQRLLAGLRNTLIRRRMRSASLVWELFFSPPPAQM